MTTDPLDAIVAEAIDDINWWADEMRPEVEDAIRAAIRADRVQHAEAVEALQMAIRPFAEAADWWDEHYPGASDMKLVSAMFSAEHAWSMQAFTLGQLRQARAALAATDAPARPEGA